MTGGTCEKVTKERENMPKVRTCDSPYMVPTTRFEEYKKKYADHFILERSESGVLMAKWHTNGDSLIWDLPVHRAIHQLTTDVGQDVETEVFILTGAGHNWVGQFGPECEMMDQPENRGWASYEHQFYDGTNIVEGLVNDIEVPTIGAINGPGFHFDPALVCDITIMSEDAVLLDGHFREGAVPGDGIQIAFRECMGLKRSTYAMLMCEKIDAEKALYYGMVNEVVPKDKIYERAWEIGEQLAKSNRILRRVTTQVLRGPWKRALAWELRNAFGAEMFAYLASGFAHGGAAHDNIVKSTGTKLLGEEA